MRYVNFARDAGAELKAGWIHGDRVVPLERLFQQLNLSLPPMPVLSPETLGDLDAWNRVIAGLDDEDLQAVTCCALDGLRLGPPIWPVISVRDFYAFEQHVKTARANRGLEMNPLWYEAPVFYFSNPRSVIGHEAPVTAPTSGIKLDYELEVALVVGKQGRDIDPAHADEYIAGYTIFNDWSLRDVQQREMKVGLGPAKGKDFATSLGPYLVTPDELEDRRTERGYDLEMVCRVNGRELSRGNWSTIYFSFAEQIARASADVTLYPGDVIGSGTVGTGCILELGPDNTGGWLKPGDVVEMEIDRLGRLRNEIVAAH